MSIFASLTVAFASILCLNSQNLKAAETEPAACPADVRKISIDRASADREIPKRPDYTQGLVFVDGQLYESTGKTGQSAIYRLDSTGGPRTGLHSLDDQLFGEGLTKLGNRFYQVTWQSGRGFVYGYDRKTLTLVPMLTFRYDGQGWGLANFADDLVLSNGSDTLSFIEPTSFAVKREVKVRLGSKSIANLNELETLGEEILANIYGEDLIVGINPRSGCVRSLFDASKLVSEFAPELAALTDPVCIGNCSSWDFVMNGIAYDAENDELYLTGKNWPKIFVFREIAD